MTRFSIVKILHKHLVETTPEELFHKADSIHTALVHLVSITHNIINHVNMMPPKHAQYMMRALGVPPEIHNSTVHYLNMIKGNPVYRRRTRELMILNMLNTAMVMIYNNLCALPPRREVRIPLSKGHILPVATANILAMDVYGSYTFYYTVTSTLLMLLKHLFVTFCHFLVLLGRLPAPAYEEMLSALRIGGDVMEKLQDLWLIERIFHAKEMGDVETKMV